MLWFVEPAASKQHGTRRPIQKESGMVRDFLRSLATRSVVIIY